MIIPVKFSQNQPCGYGGVVFEEILDIDGQITIKKA
jgi:hypothetical protein